MHKAVPNHDNNHHNARHTAKHGTTHGNGTRSGKTQHPTAQHTTTHERVAANTAAQHRANGAGGPAPNTQTTKRRTGGGGGAGKNVVGELGDIQDEGSGTEGNGIQTSSGGEGGSNEDCQRAPKKAGQKAPRPMAPRPDPQESMSQRRARKKRGGEEATQDRGGAEPAPPQKKAERNRKTNKKGHTSTKHQGLGHPGPEPTKSTSQRAPHKGKLASRQRTQKTTPRTKPKERSRGTTRRKGEEGATRPRGGRSLAGQGDQRVARTEPQTHSTDLPGARWKRRKIQGGGRA